VKGTIGIEGLRVRCRVGVRPAEKRRPRTVVVDVSVCRDIEAAVKSDKLEETLDYSNLAKQLRRAAAERHYDLIESMAGRLLEVVREQAPEAVRIRVTVRKPGAVQRARGPYVRVEYP